MEVVRSFIYLVSRLILITIIIRSGPAPWISGGASARPRRASAVCVTLHGATAC